MNYNSKYLKFILKNVAILLVTLNATITFSYTFFIHKHTLENGKVVFHSHPHKKSKDQPVKHSHNDFTFHISQKNDTLFSENSTFVFSETYIYIDYKFTIITVENTQFYTPRLRAPPFAFA